MKERGFPFNRFNMYFIIVLIGKNILPLYTLTSEYASALILPCNSKQSELISAIRLLASLKNPNPI